MARVTRVPSGGEISIPAAEVAWHPIRSMVVRRVVLGLVAVMTVAVIVYVATLVLPGDAAVAILGQTATPERLDHLRTQLGLGRPPIEAFIDWAGAFLRGDFGTSLAQNRPVLDVVLERLPNSLVLMVIVAAISWTLGLVGGLYAGYHRDGKFDQILSTVLLVFTAMPEFVVGVLVIITFSVHFVQWFPAVSMLPPGRYIWDEPSKIVLPALTLVLVCTPYVFRMVRAGTLEALNSEYAEMATLKGVSSRRLLFRHALPNALPPAITAAGLDLLYLSGGIVLVEKVFNYPGIGLTLVGAINSRDVPLIQFIVILLAALYVLINLAADVGVLIVTPRRRYPRT